VDKIAEIIGRGVSLDATCRELVEAANQAGGPDNITAALLQVDVP
jgi:serine/threonine protein phosphatase PrpC